MIPPSLSQAKLRHALLWAYARINASDVVDPVPSVYTRITMPRQKKTRYCRGVVGYNLYKPSGVPLSQISVRELGLDELEAMRLCDGEGKQQEEAAAVMGVSRGTVQRLLEIGRKKVIEALVHGDALSFSDDDHVCIGPHVGQGRGRHRFGRQGPVL